MNLDLIKIKNNLCPSLEKLSNFYNEVLNYIGKNLDKRLPQKYLHKFVIFLECDYHEEALEILCRLSYFYPSYPYYDDLWQFIDLKDILKGENQKIYLLASDLIDSKNNNYKDKISFDWQLDDIYRSHYEDKNDGDIYQIFKYVKPLNEIEKSISNDDLKEFIKLEKDYLKEDNDLSLLSIFLLCVEKGSLNIFKYLMVKYPPYQPNYLNPNFQNIKHQRQASETQPQFLSLLTSSTLNSDLLNERALNLTLFLSKKDLAYFTAYSKNKELIDLVKENYCYPFQMELQMACTESRPFFKDMDFLSWFSYLDFPTYTSVFKLLIHSRAFNSLFYLIDSNPNFFKRVFEQEIGLILQHCPYCLTKVPKPSELRWKIENWRELWELKEEEVLEGILRNGSLISLEYLIRKRYPFKTSYQRLLKLNEKVKKERMKKKVDMMGDEKKKRILKALKEYLNKGYEDLEDEDYEEEEEEEKVEDLKDCDNDYDYDYDE